LSCQRIELRLSQSHSGEPLLNGNLLLEPSSSTATIAGKRLKLGEKGFRILQLLLRSEGRMVTRQQLLIHAWGSEQRDEVSDRAVDVQLSRLRKLLQDWDGTIEMI
jgi:two-component system KDP operon response regulator KdpE